MNLQRALKQDARLRVESNEDRPNEDSLAHSGRQRASVL